MHLVPKTMTPLLHGFVEVFQPPKGLSVTGSSLPNAPTYWLAPKKTKEIERQLIDLINSGHIQYSSSPCASTAFVIPK